MEIDFAIRHLLRQNPTYSSVTSCQPLWTFQVWKFNLLVENCFKLLTAVRVEQWLCTAYSSSSNDLCVNAVSLTAHCAPNETTKKPNSRNPAANVLLQEAECSQKQFQSKGVSVFGFGVSSFALTNFTVAHVVLKSLQGGFKATLFCCVVCFV